jgi:hypothetical protein
MIRKIILIAAASLTASAQSGADLATITRIEGIVYLDEIATTATGSPVRDATIRTASGRAVIHLRGNGTLFIGENSAVRVFDNRPFNFNRLEMIDGSAVLATGAGAGMVACEDAVNLSDHALVRMDLHPIPASPYGEHSCRFKVYEGAASAQLTSIATVLRAGKMMALNRRAGDMIPWNDFNSSDRDDFDRWTTMNR